MSWRFLPAGLAPKQRKFYFFSCQLKKAKRQKGKMANKWNDFVADYRRKHPGLSFKQVLVEAGKEYRQGAPKKAAKPAAPKKSAKPDAPKRATKRPVAKKTTKTAAIKKDAQQKTVVFEDNFRGKILDKHLDETKRTLLLTLKYAPFFAVDRNVMWKIPENADRKVVPQLRKVFKKVLSYHLKDFWTLKKVVGGGKDYIQISLQAKKTGKLETLYPDDLYDSLDEFLDDLADGFNTSYSIKFPFRTDDPLVEMYQQEINNFMADYSD